MDALISSSFRAVRSLFAPGMFGIFILCVLTTLVALFIFAGIASACFICLAGHFQHVSWLHALAFGGPLVSLWLAWFLFPGVMPIFVNFFGERIAATIERQDYPAAMTHVPRFWPEFMHDLRFSIMTVLLNIIVLPLYLVPGLNLILFYLLNGYLLGREFFVMAARRHISAGEAESLRKQHFYTVLAAGALLTFLATLPFINLFAPFWGIAVMVHLYQRLA